MMTRAEMLGRLQDRGARFSVEEELVYWDDKSVLIRHSRFGEERARAGGDAVVISAGAELLNSLTS